MKAESGRGYPGIRRRANIPAPTERNRRAWRSMARKLKVVRANLRALGELQAARAPSQPEDET